MKVWGLSAPATGPQLTPSRSSIQTISQSHSALEPFIHTLESLSPALIYCSLFAVAYIENVFPPSPSDVVVVFGGYLVGLGTIDFTVALAVTTTGSITGFLTMYKV